MADKVVKESRKQRKDREKREAAERANRAGGKETHKAGPPISLSDALAKLHKRKALTAKRGPQGESSRVRRHKALLELGEWQGEGDERVWVGQEMSVDKLWLITTEALGLADKMTDDDKGLKAMQKVMTGLWRLHDVYHHIEPVGDRESERKGFSSDEMIRVLAPQECDFCKDKMWAVGEEGVKEYLAQKAADEAAEKAGDEQPEAPGDDDTPPESGADESGEAAGEGAGKESVE